jgi:hypothetical protein
MEGSCLRHKEDAGLPDTNRRDPHKAGESPALHKNWKKRREPEEGRCRAKARRYKKEAADPSPPFANDATGFGPAKSSGMQTAQMTADRPFAAPL